MAVRGRHQSRKGPTHNLPHTANRPPARRRSTQQRCPARPRGGGAAATQQRGARPEAGGRGRARATESRSLPKGRSSRSRDIRTGNAHVGGHAHREGRTARARPCINRSEHARAPVRVRAPRPPESPTCLSYTPQGAGAREPRDILHSGAAPRSLGPRGSGPPAPARRCVGWARCLRPVGSPHPCPHCSPHPATSSSPPPPPPLYPPAPPHRWGPRFRRRRSKIDRIFPSQLPGRHLTFNPHSQWVPNAPLAITEASDPARVEAASWPNLKGTLLPRLEAWPRAPDTARRAWSVGRSAPPSDAPPCWAEPGPEIGLELEPGLVGARSLLSGPTFSSHPRPPSVAQPHVGRGPVSCLR